jgi:hypothetical protein
MFDVNVVVPARFVVPQGKFVAFAHKSLAGGVGAEHDVHVNAVVQQFDAVPHAAFVL